MKVDELPRFLQTLESLPRPFDAQSILYDSIFRSGYLHFGFWPAEGDGPADLQRLLDNVRRAQARFAEELLAHLPPGRHRVLDVGAGFGRLASRLTAAGHAVTAVTPCAHQASEIIVRHPGVAVVRGRLEEVGPALPAGGFDVIVFSESFRYVHLPRALAIVDRLLARDGRVLIADWFAREPAAARPAGGGHDHVERAFREAIAAYGLAVVAERDVTGNVLHTVKLAHDVLCELYLPLVGFAFATLAQRRRRVFRLALRVWRRWFEPSVLRHLPGLADPAAFTTRYRYLFVVLGRRPVS
jgi:SAM-dependent methyltransferase